MRGTALRYGAAGLVNSALGWAVIFALDALGVAAGVANACGFAVGIGVSFVLHRSVFGARRDGGETARYAASVAVAFVLNQAVLHLALTVPAPPALTHACGQAMGVISYSLALFCLSRWWVFPSGPVLRPT